MIGKSFDLLIIVLMFMVVMGAVLSFPIMLLWNYCLVPAVPIVTEITWLQAWGLFVLFGILFRNNSTAGE